MSDVVAKPDFSEIAVITGGRDITRGFIPWNLLEPQDRVLRVRGYDYQLYEFVLGDDQVKSCLQQRQLAVLSRDWQVQPGGTDAVDQKAADSLREQIQALEWDHTTEKMLFGLFYGFSVAECLWARDGAQVVLDQVKVRNRRRFKFGVDQKPKLITFQKPLGEELPDRKFWTFCTGADNDDEPYGLGLAYWLYWPVWFKRNDIRFWLTFLDKFGQPTVTGTYPPNASDGEKQNLLASASAVWSNTAVILPEGTSLTLLEAARSGTPDYQALLDTMNAAIAKIILSQTMTTDDGSSLSQAQVHGDVKDQVVKSDATLVSASFNNGPARWLTEWNYPGAKTPVVSRKLDAMPDLAQTAARDKTIYDMGFEPTEDYIRATYGDGFVKRQMPTAPGPFGGPPGLDQPSFAAGGGSPRAVVGALSDQLADHASPTIDAMVSKVRDLLENAASLEEVRDGLIDLYPDLDMRSFADVMARAVTASDLAGRSEVGRPR